MKLKNKKDLKSLRLSKKNWYLQEHLKRRPQKESERFTQPWFFVANIGNVMNILIKKTGEKIKKNWRKDKNKSCKKAKTRKTKTQFLQRLQKNTTSKKKIEDNSDSSNFPIDVDDDMDLSDNGELKWQVGKYAVIKYEEKYYPVEYIRSYH